MLCRLILTVVLDTGVDQGLLLLAPPRYRPLEFFVKFIIQFYHSYH